MKSLGDIEKKNPFKVPENYFEDFSLITQNIDNLHTIAGSKHTIELHGNITRNRCSGCDDITVFDKNTALEEIPKCSKCGSVLRPDVVLFGEELNKKVLAKAQEVSAVCEVFISIGTSSLVEPAASLPYIAKGNGAYLLEINTERTDLSNNCDEVITGDQGCGSGIELQQTFSRLVTRFPGELAPLDEFWLAA